MAQKKRSLADRVKTAANMSISAEAQEKALEQLKKSSTPSEAKKKVRVSVDFPEDLYARMKEETEANGQTHRGFIISLVREYYNK